MSVGVFGQPVGKSILAVVVTLAPLLARLVFADESSESLPRYRFEVGQELVYKLTSSEELREESDGGPASLDQMEWRIFVVRKNDDGSWRVFIRTNISFITKSGRVRAKRNSLGYCDIHPDGSYTLDEQTAVAKRLLPHELFCRLPDHNSELKKGWRYEAPVDGSSYVFGPTVRDGMVLQIKGVVNTAYERMHQWETTRQYRFDLERGLVDRVVRDFRRLEGGLVRRQTMDLTFVVTREPKWISQFHNEANDYLAAYDRWFKLCTEVGWTRNADKRKSALQQARAILESGRDKSELEIIQGIYDANIEEHDEHSEWTIKDAVQREAFFAEVPKFSTDWQASNLDGSNFQLTDQRGKVVVLDFWGTNCEYCVLVAPQISKLAQEYEDKGVVFLGMFDRRDADESDEADKEDAKAQSLIESIYSDIPHLEADEIVERYRLREFRFGYPLVLVLNQEGAIHELQQGYSAYFPQRMRLIIDGLLRNPIGKE